VGAHCRSGALSQRGYEQIRAQLKERFENLTDEAFEVQSPETWAYNCFGWAMGESERWWYPPSSKPGQYWPIQEGAEEFWPHGVLAAPFVPLFEKAFSTKGYESCEAPDLETDLEKVAIYGYETQEARHAARQLTSGNWTSKIGHSVDLEHTSLDVLEGAFYGRVVAVMARPRRQPPDPPSFPHLVAP
jgi:hypothetical protein